MHKGYPRFVGSRKMQAGFRIYGLGLGSHFFFSSSRRAASPTSASRDAACTWCTMLGRLHELNWELQVRIWGSEFRKWRSGFGFRAQGPGFCLRVRALRFGVAAAVRFQDAASKV